MHFVLRHLALALLIVFPIRNLAERVPGEKQTNNRGELLVRQEFRYGKPVDRRDMRRR